MNTDSKTLAYINMFGVLARLQDLCEFSAEAKVLLPEKPLALNLRVKNGPEMTLRFEKNKCFKVEGGGSNILLPFSTCEKFNGMVDGTYTPIPRKGFSHIKFLTHQFKDMTDILETYLRPQPEKLKDEIFFRDSTTLMFYVIVHALAEIGNHDQIGQYSASGIADGNLLISILGGPSAAITIRDHQLKVAEGIPDKVHGVMEFADLKVARGIFDGELNAKACIGSGQVTVRGRLAMIDDMNRILDRVALYLA